MDQYPLLIPFKQSSMVPVLIIVLKSIYTTFLKGKKPILQSSLVSPDLNGPALSVLGISLVYAKKKQNAYVLSGRTYSNCRKGCKNKVTL